MGVNGLWKLVEPCGKPVPIDTLENKILAVDISIWLHQVIKGIQDSKGSAVAHAHLLGLFHRLCKLLYYKIKPVFVFDGSVPHLKRETIARRNMQRNKLLSEADRIQALLLKSLAKEKIVQQALGKNVTELLIKSPSKQKKVSNASDDIDKMFKLPDLSYNLADDTNSDSSFMKENTSLSDSSFDDEESSHNCYSSNLQAIDVKSENFQRLPAEIRHEILIDIKETRKQSSWGKLHELPSHSDDFSSYQMKKLLKRRQVQECLEEAEKEMGGKTLTLHELKNLFTEEGIVEAVAPASTKHIISNDNARYLLVRDLKKSMAAKKEPLDENLTSSKTDPNISDSQFDKASELSMGDVASCSQKSCTYEDKFVESKPVLDEKNDLELAIQYSLDDLSNNTKEAKTSIKNDDYTLTVSPDKYDPDLELAIQMSLESIADIDNSKVKTQKGKCEDETNTKDIPNMYVANDPATSVLDNHDTDLELAIRMSLENIKKSDLSESKIKETENPANDSDSSDTSSDLEEVGESDPVICEQSKKQNNLEIFVDLTESVNESNDIFSDIFEKEQLPNLPEKEKSSFEKVSTSHEKTLSILNDMRKQINEINMLTLDDICIVETKPSCPVKEASEDSAENEIENVSENKNQTDTLEIVEEDKEGNKPTASSEIESDGQLLKNDDFEPPSEKIIKISEIFDIDNSTKNENDKSNDSIQFNLERLAQDIEKEKLSLEKERNRQDRMGISLTDRMNKECMQLLRLFGVPYIVAPMEAEAQCAFLDAMNLTNGTITDDSDIWLFGGRTVYKNFFAQNKNVLEYKAEHIEKTFNVDRNKLIQLAILVGSDYTTGINGVGAVTALEILAQFSMCAPNPANERSAISSVLATLRAFRDWWTSNKGSVTVGNSAKISLRKKLKNIDLQEGFPSIAVAEAYLSPKLDDNTETFSWSPPDVESIREFTRANFGWTRSKTDEILTPVLKKINEKISQATIKDYFAVKRSATNQIMLSRRVQRAINAMSKQQSNEPEPEPVPIQNDYSLKGRKRKCKKGDNASKLDQEEPSSSKIKVPSSISDVIPQRETERLKLEKNKEIAISVLRAQKRSKSQKK